MGDSLPFCSLKDKENAYATVSTRHTLTSALKTPLPSLRITNRDRPSLRKISASLPVCPIAFDSRLPCLTPTRQSTPSLDKFRLRKCIWMHGRGKEEGGRGGRGGREWGGWCGEVLVHALRAKRISL